MRGETDRVDVELLVATIEQLQPEQVERMHDKLVVALNRARDNTVLGVLSRDKRYSLGDLPLISADIDAAEALDAVEAIEV